MRPKRSRLSVRKDKIKKRIAEQRNIKNKEMQLRLNKNKRNKIYKKKEVIVEKETIIKKE